MTQTELKTVYDEIEALEEEIAEAQAMGDEALVLRFWLASLKLRLLAPDQHLEESSERGPPTQLGCEPLPK